MRNQLFLAVPAEAWERIFGEKDEQKECCATCYHFPGNNGLCSQRIKEPEGSVCAIWHCDSGKITEQDRERFREALIR